MTARLTLALTAAEKDLLERAARLNGRSLSSELAVRVRRTLGEREPQGGDTAASMEARPSSQDATAREPVSRSPSDPDGSALVADVMRAQRDAAAVLPSDLAGKAKPDPRGGRR